MYILFDMQQLCGGQESFLLLYLSYAKSYFCRLLLLQEKQGDEWKRSNQLMDHIQGKTLFYQLTIFFRGLRGLLRDIL